MSPQSYVTTHNIFLCGFGVLNLDLCACKEAANKLRYSSFPCYQLLTGILHLPNVRCMLKSTQEINSPEFFFSLLHLTKCHPDFSACAFPALRSLPGCRKWHALREPSARAWNRCQRLFILSTVGRGQGTMRPQFAPVALSCLHSATSCCQAPCNSFLFVFFLTTWSSGCARAEAFSAFLIRSIVPGTWLVPHRFGEKNK